MTFKPGWKGGRWQAVCDVCGFKFHSDMLSRRWDGLMVCHADLESRHPQDFLRSVSENITPPWTRPEPEDTFANVCDLITSQGRADWGTAGCAQAGYSMNFDGLEDFGVDAVADIAIANMSFASARKGFI